MSSTVYSDFTSFPQCHFSVSGSHSGTTLHCHYVSLLYSSLLLVSQTFPFIDNMEFLKSPSQSFCRNSVWFHSMFFHVYTGVMGFREKDYRYKVSFSSFMSRWYPIDMTYHGWCEPWSLEWESFCQVSL